MRWHDEDDVYNDDDDDDGEDGWVVSSWFALSWIDFGCIKMAWDEIENHLIWILLIYVV